MLREFRSVVCRDCQHAFNPIGKQQPDYFFGEFLGFLAVFEPEDNNIPGRAFNKGQNSLITILSDN
jgi:hypothetical protein